MKTKSILIISGLLLISASTVMIIVIKNRQGSTNRTDITTSIEGGNIPLNQQSSQSTTLPTPDQYGQYEQYKDATSSIYVEVLAGTGTEAVSGNKVTVAYKGWLTDGTLFDQSKEGQPFIFTLGAHQVIVGWDQGINGMKVGGKRRLIVPSSAGYGSAGNGPIPANALLVFDVELFAVE